MLFKDWQRRKKLNVRLLQPELPVLAPEIDAIVAKIIADYFPEIKVAPSIFFGHTPTLAHIEGIHGASPPSIWVHLALNDPETPEYVFSYVMKHELLHTRIRPREVDGKWLSHPPEFWQEQTRICGAERERGSDWLDRNFWDALQRDAALECIWVRQPNETASAEPPLRLRRFSPPELSLPAGARRIALRLPGKSFGRRQTRTRTRTRISVLVTAKRSAPHFPFAPDPSFS